MERAAVRQMRIASEMKFARMRSASLSWEAFVGKTATVGWEKSALEKAFVLAAVTVSLRMWVGNVYQRAEIAA